MENYPEMVAKYNQECYEWYRKSSLTVILNISMSRKRKIAAIISQMMNEGLKKKRKSWVSPLCQLRSIHGFFAAIYPTLRTMDKEFLNYFRMSIDKFENLLALVGPKITKKDSVRKSISAVERLSLTLR